MHFGGGWLLSECVLLFTKDIQQLERNVKKQIDISLELLYTLSRIRNTNLKGDDFYEI